MLRTPEWERNVVTSTAARRWNPSSLFKAPERSCRAIPPIHCAEPGFTSEGEDERSPTRSCRRRNPPLSIVELGRASCHRC
nr:hypothetical protein Itr_chr12CG17940 [Ipomoea trifida]